MVKTVDPLALGPAPETNGSGPLHAYIVQQDPEMLVVPNFLSDAEMEHMLELAEDLWKPSAVQVGDSKMAKYNSARTSSSCIFEPGHTDVVKEVEGRLSRLTGIGIEHLEQLALVRYHPGEFFAKHHDGQQRSKTVFIYLNDLEEDAGGETIFPELGIQFMPRRGCAVVWNNVLPNGDEDSRLVHAGMPPSKGVKFGVNCFFNRKPLLSRGCIGGDMPVEWNKLVNTEEQEREQWNAVDSANFREDDVGEAPGPLRLVTVNVDPKVSIVPNIVTAEEAGHMVEYGKTPKIRDPSPELKAIFGAVQLRLCAVAGEPYESLTDFQVAKYRPGVIPHGLSLAGDAEYAKKYGRKVIFVFLNDLEEGQLAGELRFPRLGFEVKPRARCGVLWSTMLANGESSLQAAHQPRAPSAGQLFSAIAIFGSTPPSA